jgi:hypothetical protein
MKGKKTSTASGQTSSPKPVTQQQIAALAHELWLAQGCPSGRDMEIWLEAERQLAVKTDGVGPLHRDPIPADPSRPTPDEDPALLDDATREADAAVPARDPRSPTALR